MKNIRSVCIPFSLRLFMVFTVLLSLITIKPAAKKRAAAIDGLPSTCFMVCGETMDISTLLNDKVSFFCTSKPSVVFISDKGIVKASRPGTACILYSSYGKLYSCQFIVSASGKNGFNQYGRSLDKKTPDSLTGKKEQIDIIIDNPVLFIEKGDSYKINYDITPDSYQMRNSLSWTSSDSSVVKAGAGGKITATGKGSAVVTCSAGSASKEVYINVVDLSYNGGACDFSILTSKGKKRTYRLFKQNAHNYSNYNRYLSWHGCATCSLATVLGAYQSSYSGITPDTVIDGPEKAVADASSWKREHQQRALKSQMPLSLYGISQILEHYGVKNTYVRSYQEALAKKDITEHLGTGNAVIFEVRQKSNLTGKKSRRWTNSYHTMVLLGAMTNGKVLLCDSIDRSWYNGGQRLKIVELADVMEYMFPCTSFSKSLYYDGASSDGGYIKISDVL